MGDSNPPVPPPDGSFLVTVNGLQPTPPPIPTSPPHVAGSSSAEIIVDTTLSPTASTSTPTTPIETNNGTAHEEQEAITAPPSVEEVLQKFLDYEGSLAVSSYIKQFYSIRLEQESLRSEDEYACGAACNPVHYARNRYRDILPYDHNRVALTSSEENPDGYMNASFVQLPGGKTKFIAAQAPLPATLDEWWQMIDEQKISLIVMLCRLMEMNKVKCERYWPENKGEKLVFGNYEITLEDEQTFDDDEYLLRILKMDNCSTGVSRTVQQLHYREWPDHGCPAGETQLLNMIDKMAEVHIDKEVPILVHCSAGVGRTGTIIAVNHIREMLEQGMLNEISLYQLVMTLRKQRSSMVQTQDQYQFVHKCVARYARKRLGLPEPQPKERTEFELPKLSPTAVYPNIIPPDTPDVGDDVAIPLDEGTVVPDFPHEPPAPRGPEELGSAAS